MTKRYLLVQACHSKSALQPSPVVLVVLDLVMKDREDPHLKEGPRFRSGRQLVILPSELASFYFVQPV